VKIKFYKLYLVFKSNSAISDVRHSTEKPGRPKSS